MDPSEASASVAQHAESCELALCLSGGGYRAMLFHVGALWRLNELGFLARLDRVSSVSGGSITAGVLAKHWDQLDFHDGIARRFDTTVAADLLEVASRTIDIGAVLRGLLSFGRVGDRVAGSYRRHIFGARTLQDIPSSPRFIINSTSLQSGALWRFSKPYMADYQVGLIRHPTVPLAKAVAASSAFPPFLSPVTLPLKGEQWDPAANGPLHKPPFTSHAILSDGGVYDNLGLQPAWDQCQTVLISDGGGHFTSKTRPASLWPLQAIRVTAVIDHQVRAQRGSNAVKAFQEGRKRGAYWGISTRIAEYDIHDALPCPPERTDVLASTKTRLARLDAVLQHRLVNWGYAVSDAAMRRYVAPDAPAAERFPYPEDGV